jgi:hypothetical protein
MDANVGCRDQNQFPRAHRFGAGRAGAYGMARLPAADRVLYFFACAVLLGDALRLVAGVGASTMRQTEFLRLDVVIVIASALGLCALGWIASRRNRTSDALAFAIGLACGLMYFARTLGSALADPLSIGWLLHGDWAQHYSGWAMFRHAPWHWPPGLLPEIWYPVGTSIVYTDSLPLFALALKPFSTLLPDPFQYIGAWLLLNSMLQGGFAALLIARFRREPSIVLSGAALFVFAPVVISRIDHDTLTAHWLLLAAFWIYFRDRDSRRVVDDALPWWVLAAIAALVHPYLAAMCLSIQAAFWWKRVRTDGGRPRSEALAAFAGSLVISLCMWWLSGSMTIGARDGAGGVAFGKYSFNLLGFINPMSFSRWLPTLPSLPEQYEGFAYLGVGMLVLGLFVAVDFARDRRPRGAFGEYVPLAVVAGCSLAFAASSVLAVGSWIIVDVPIESPVLGLFRSSGRFIWVAYYALMLLIIVRASIRFRPPVAASILTATLIAQMADFSTAHAHIARLRLSADSAPKGTLLDDPRWGELASGRRHMTLLPPAGCDPAAEPYLPFTVFASDHGMTLNSGFIARWNMRATSRYCLALREQLEAGIWSDDDIYVVAPVWKNDFERNAPDARCDELNGYDVCVVGPTASNPRP